MSKSFDEIFAETNSIPVIREWTDEDRKLHAAEWTRQYDKGVQDGAESVYQQVLQAFQESESACSGWAIALLNKTVNRTA